MPYLGNASYAACALASVCFASSTEVGLGEEEEVVDGRDELEESEGWRVRRVREQDILSIVASCLMSDLI